ncbi:MAG TPA: nuclear transport factor 2 family protein [Candidatus Limnocylindrales bacterium]|nr:nuclear transport factor 2 family protein [Candidatus Limnocylindrales bacterium]
MTTNAEFHEAWTTPPTPPASDADRAAVEDCVRDYYESWFEADGDRMGRALHPALAKRSYGQGLDRAPELDESTRDQMIEAARTGWGVPRGGGEIEIRVCEVSGGIASAVAHAEHYIDYLHLIATPDGWKIINAVWRWADGHGPRG